MSEKEQKVIIVTDVAADLPSDEILKSHYGVEPIPQIPLDVSFGNDNFTVGETMNNQDFRKKLETSMDIPKTAGWGSERIKGIYENLLSGGTGKKLLLIHLRDKFSSTGDNARMAAKEIDPEGKRIEIYNSGNVTMAEGMMAIEAKRMAESGFSRNEITQRLDLIKQSISMLAIAPNIPFLRASGRISGAQAFIAGALKIKPILQIDRDNDSKTLEKVVGTKKAIRCLADFVEERKETGIEEIAVLDLGAEEDGDNLVKQLIIRGIPEKIIYRGELGPITGTHGGIGTVAMVVRETI